MLLDEEGDRGNNDVLFCLKSGVFDNELLVREWLIEFSMEELQAKDELKDVLKEDSDPAYSPSNL